MTTGPTIKRGKSKQDYGTPWEFIKACERRFGPITFDLAASQENKKAGACFTIEDDSLSRNWHKLGGLLWLNPEFSDITPWAVKCAEEGELGAKILFLTPASVGANWFADHVHKKAMVFGLKGRLTFEGCDQPYPKDCILSVYGYGVTGFDVWDWRKP